MRASQDVESLMIKKITIFLKHYSFLQLKPPNPGCKQTQSKTGQGLIMRFHGLQRE